MATQSWVNSEYRMGLSMLPLLGPSVEDQRSGGVVSYLHYLGADCSDVQDPVAQGGVQAQGPELNDELGGYHGIEG